MIVIPFATIRARFLVEFFAYQTIGWVVPLPDSVLDRVDYS